MAELAALARPYAEAVFLTAEGNGKVDTWSDELGFLKQVMSDARIKGFVQNPKVSKQELEDTMLDICKGQMQTDGLNLVKLLIKNNRLQLSSEIAEQYEVRKAQKDGALDVKVTSAFPMSDSDQDELVKSLSVAFGKEVKISVEEDSSLIGGMVIRAGDKVIDSSLSGQIQQLAKQLK